VRSARSRSCATLLTHGLLCVHVAHGLGTSRAVRRPVAADAGADDHVFGHSAVLQVRCCARPARCHPTCSASPSSPSSSTAHTNRTTPPRRAIPAHVHHRHVRHSFMMEYDIHTLLDALTLVATGGVLYALLLTPIKTTYQSDLDTIKWYYVVRSQSARFCSTKCPMHGHESAAMVTAGHARCVTAHHPLYSSVRSCPNTITTAHVISGGAMCCFGCHRPSIYHTLAHLPGAGAPYVAAAAQRHT
jgi:hypothetical protein